MAALDQLLDSEVRLSAQQLGVLKTLTTLVGSIHGKLVGLKPGAPGAGPKPKPKDKDAPAGPGLGKLLGTAGGAIGAAVGAIASIPAAVAGIVAVASKFVSALNPSLVEQYDTQLRNLQATIGYALEPVIAYATRSVKEFGGILLPAIQKIRPIVDQLSRGVSGLASGAVRVLGRALEWAAGVAQKVLPYVVKNLESVGALFEVWAAAIETVSQFGGIMEELVSLSKIQSDGIRGFVKNLAIAGARLVSIFGGKEALDNFKKALAKNLSEKSAPRAGLTAAPKDAAISGIDDVLKKLNERAFLAGGGVEAKAPDVAALEEINRTIQGLEYKSLKTLITEAVRDAQRDAPRAVARGASDVISGESNSTGISPLVLASPGAAVTTALFGKK
ncbi:MAG TPA: hypothetical protein VGE74_10640 [Gemmata sp.]